MNTGYCTASEKGKGKTSGEEEGFKSILDC